MKKETIFKHEINESMAADAAMSCLKNRNTHKQINEVAPVVAAAGRMLLPMLRPIITKLVQKALVKIGTHARPAEVLKLVMGMLTKGELAKKMAEKCGQTWNEIPNNVKKEIQNAIIDAFKAQSPQEQEETVNIPQLAEDVVASYRGRLSNMDEKERVNFISTMVMKKMGKTIDILTPQEKKEILAAAKHSMWYVSEQEELPQMERHDMILALTQYLDECWIDSDEDGDLDDLYYAVAKVLDRTGDYPASTAWEDCKPWCEKYCDEVEETLLGGGF